MEYASQNNIFVINLKISAQRRKHIQNQFNKLPKKINFEFFEAINGNENPDFYLFKKHNAEKRFKYKGSKTTLGQLGCFASHYLLWEKCVKLNRPIIILEDDIIINSDFCDVYSFLNSKDNIYEFLYLTPPITQKKKKYFKN